MKRTVSELDPVPYTTTQIIEKTGDWRTLKPNVKRELCTICKICIDFCPDGVIFENEDSVKIDYNYCKGCGICATECPSKAIEMLEER
ncbi:MAG: 4Fe-4S binding protein [Candidatus Heimdallarchaeota archaeon]